MNRREFLQRSSVLAGAAYLNAPAFADAISTLGNPNLVIGIVSDIHISGTESTVTFKHTLEYFRSLQVDGVIIAGDMADHGLEPELKLVADTWYSVFPKNKGVNDKHTEKLFIYGNHDLEAYTWNGTIDLAGRETAEVQGIGKRTGVRAFDFEVQVEWEWLDCRFISATKRVFSPKSLFAEAQDEGEVTCVFAVSELPKDRSYRFVVRPCNCYSGKGDPIYTEWIKK